jgi:hypothetical protein
LATALGTVATVQEHSRKTRSSSMIVTPPAPIQLPEIRALPTTWSLSVGVF